MEKQISPLQMKAFESAYALKDLKAGDVITQRQVDAIEFYFGGVLKVVRSMPLKETVINFESGKPVIEKDELGIKEIRTE